MKIGYDAKRAFLNTSGLGNYSRNTLNALQKFHPEHNYTLLTPERKKGMLEKQEAFEIVAPPLKSSGIKKSLWRTFHLCDELEECKLDLFHGLSNELPKGIHKTKIPSIVTIHDLIFIRYPQFYKPIDKSIYFQKVKYACKAANKIIAISQQTKDDIIDFIGTPPEKIEIIHQAISPLFFNEADTNDVKLKYNLPDEFIISVGTIEERKNQLSILKALSANKLNIHVVFVGNPTSYCNDIHKYIAEKKIENQVIFLKNIPERDLSALFQLAKLSIYISVFEGFGLPVIESMASGCPVITSNVSCLPETAGDAALLCSPESIEDLGEAILSLLKNQKLKKELIIRGKIRAEEFRPKVHIEKLISLYSEIIKQQKCTTT